MKIVFNSFRLISSEIGPSHCQLYVCQMLPSLYKVCEGFAGKLITGNSCRLIDVKNLMYKLITIPLFARSSIC